MSNKCDNCNKSITKTVPGIECNKCERLVHLSTKCTGLTNKQVAALKAASPGLGWTCLECIRDSSKCNSSIVMPEDDDDDDDTNSNPDTKNLINDISKHVEKTIKKEMKEISDSLQFHSAKLDEVMGCIELFKPSLKVLEKKNTELTDKNNNLETRVGALEQQIQAMEQEKLSKQIEVSNVPYHCNENVQNIVEHLARKLNVPKTGIKQSRRLKGREDRDGNLLVELKEEAIQSELLAAARSTSVTVADIYPQEPGNNGQVYIRECMTRLNKQIMWLAKQELKIKQKYKYVWFKKDYVKARKDDQGKIFYLRSLHDVSLLANKKQ